MTLNELRDLCDFLDNQGIVPARVEGVCERYWRQATRKRQPSREGGAAAFGTLCPNRWSELRSRLAGLAERILRPRRAT